MAYAAWSVVFAEQPSATKWNILGTNDAHFYSFLGDNLAWQSWTPTLSGRFDDAKWTKACKYQKIGKTVACRISLTASTTTPMSGGVAEAIFTLPVTAVALAATNLPTLGRTRILDSGTTVTNADVEQINTTTAQIRYDAVVSSLVVPSSVTSTAPMTWTTNDAIDGYFIYEAA